MPELISIDFGTTKTAIAFRDLKGDSDPQVVNFGGHYGNALETVLRFSEDGRDVEEMGRDAWDNCLQYPDRTFYEFKTEIGSAKDFWVAGTKQNATYLTKTFLTHLRLMTEKLYNGTPVSPKNFTTWIGHPAEWNEAQKTQLLKCARDAGWPNVDLCDEARATAFYYADRGDLPQDGKSYTFMVFDFGGGTLDVCIMTLDDKRIADILAVGGDNIGGRHFDDCLTEHFSKDILAKAGKDHLPLADLSEVRRCCRKLKEGLSDQIRLKNKEQVSYTIPRLLVLSKDQYTLNLSRVLFDELTESLQQGCRTVVDEVINKAEIDRTQIEKILITGGSSHLYFVEDLIKSALPDITQENIKRVPQPSEVVAKGLGLYPLPKKIQKTFPSFTPSAKTKQEITLSPPSTFTAGGILRKRFIYITIVIIVASIALYVFKSGNEKPIEPSNSICTVCGGDGKVPCPRCGGDGKRGLWGLQDGILTCKECNGTGESTCTACGGDGRQ